MKILSDSEQELFVKTFLPNATASEILTRYLFTNNLDGIEILLFRDDNGVLIPNFSSIDGNDVSILNLGSSNKISYFSKEEAENIVNEKSQLTYVNVFHFDSNIIGYIYKLFQTRDKKKYNFIYKLLKGIISIKMADFTAYPYLMENLYKINDYTHEMIEEKLFYFEIYKSFNSVSDFVAYFDDYEENFNKIGLRQKVKEFVCDIENSTTVGNNETIYRFYKGAYLLLLESVIINFSSQKNINKKFEQLLSFWINEFGYFSEREMAICYMYLNKDKRVEQFFEKIQGNRKTEKILETLQGMAWDLAHIRFLEIQYFTDSYNGTTNFEIHRLITRDNGLKDILKSYPIDMIVKLSNNQVFPFMKKTFSEFTNEQLFSKYWKKRKPEKRKTIAQKTDYLYLISQKEEELHKYFK